MLLAAKGQVDTQTEAKIAILCWDLSCATRAFLVLNDDEPQIVCRLLSLAGPHPITSIFNMPFNQTMHI